MGGKRKVPDLNDVLFNAIEKSTGDKIRPEVQLDDNNELLKAVLGLLTVVLKKMVDTPSETLNEVTPFVS